MTNDVTHISNNELDPFAELGSEANQRRIHGNLLRYTKHGAYKTGLDQETLALGTRMLAYMPGLEKGWIKWRDNQPVQYIMGYVRERFQVPERETLGDLDQALWQELGGRKLDPWQLTFHLVMLDENGELHTFVTSSKGGKDAIAKLSTAYSEHKKMKPEEIPIIQLQGESYSHREFGETFKPIFKVDGWSKIPNDFTELETAMSGGGEIEDNSAPFLIEAKPVVNVQEKVKSKAPAPPPTRGKSKNGRKGVRF